MALECSQNMGKNGHRNVQKRNQKSAKTMFQKSAQFRPKQCSRNVHDISHSWRAHGLHFQKWLYTPNKLISGQFPYPPHTPDRPRFAQYPAKSEAPEFHHEQDISKNLLSENSPLSSRFSPNSSRPQINGRPEYVARKNYNNLKWPVEFNLFWDVFSP